MKRFCTLAYTLALLTFATLAVLPKSHAQEALFQPTVRLVYFLPKDRPARPERITALQQLIKDAQEFFAEQMEHHGYGRKTFRVETDKDGEPVVHQIHGKFEENYYHHKDPDPIDYKIWEELFEHFNDPEHIYFIAIDIGQETLGTACGFGGPIFIPSGEGKPRFVFDSAAVRHRGETPGEQILGGSAIIPASGPCFFDDVYTHNHPLRITTHELGHAFGIEHDFELRHGYHNETVMGGSGHRLSEGNAAWLSVHRFFTTQSIGDRNRPGSIKLRRLWASGQGEIHLRFEVSDPDGLHQGQLLVPGIVRGESQGAYRLFDYKPLTGTNMTVEFIIDALTADPVDRIMVQIIDKGGGITWTTVLADIASLLPRPKVVSIPDPNLATAVRKALDLTPNAPITDQAMQKLTRLDAQERQIKNLTGLEHAARLESLELRKNEITDIRPLANLKRLEDLILEVNKVRDIRPLANLTQLKLLYIAANPISDFTPLANLIDLRRLALWDNDMSGNVPLVANMIQLTHLHLWNCNLSDIRPLANLSQLSVLHLQGNQIRDVSPLANLKKLQELSLSGNPITDTSPLRILKQQNPNLKLDIEIPPPAPVRQIGTGQRPPMYWVDADAGTLHRLITDEVETLTPNAQNVTHLAVDMARGRLYWTEKTSNRTGRIRRANLDGTDVQIVKVLTSVPHGIALDTAGGKIYLTNSWGKVQRLNVDGSNFEPNLITDLDAPRHLALDVSRGKLYWTETAGRILRSNLNGSNVQTLATDLGTLGGIATADGKLYWTEQIGENAGRIQCANLDGTNIQTLASLQSVPLGIAVDATGRKLYWTNSRGRIQRTDLNGSSVQNLVIDLNSPTGITLGLIRDDVAVPETSLEKITGPWLWMIAPTETGRGGAASNNVDSLADASDGSVTEADVAVNGAKAGDAVGNYVWTLGTIAESGGNNVNDLLNNIGMARGDVNDHSSYTLITLESATAQSNVTMRVGSDDAIKIWLNGEIVHNNPIDREAEDFQDRFKVNLKQGDNLLLVKVSERDGGWSMFVGIDTDVKAVYKLPPDPPDPVVSEDVNGDGVVNILDLVSVSVNFGKTGKNIADVNGDGVVNIVDLVKVAGEMGNVAGAPAAHPQTLEILTAADVRHWLIQAQSLNLTDAAVQRGIRFLEQFLEVLMPKASALLPNYPNPFNPETWIPYQLAKPADVTLTIYATNGTLIRTLALGHQPPGMYHSKTRAAYWDGKNEVGEPVASGLYFYTLSAGDFTSTRKMLILK